MIIIKQNRITIDELGKMVKNGFEESHSELLEVKNKMNSRFDDLEGQIGKIRSNYATTDEHNRLDERVKRVERRVLISS